THIGASPRLPRLRGEPPTEPWRKAGGCRQPWNIPTDSLCVTLSALCGEESVAIARRTRRPRADARARSMPRTVTTCRWPIPTGWCAAATVIVDTQCARAHRRSVQGLDHTLGDVGCHFDDGERVAHLDAAHLCARDV